MSLIKAKFMLYAAGSEAWRAGSSRWLTSCRRLGLGGRSPPGWPGGAGNCRLEGENGAAERLGISPSTLRSRMRKHGIQEPGRRPSEEAWRKA